MEAPPAPTPAPEDQPPSGSLLRILRRPSRTKAFMERLDGLELTMLQIPSGRFLMGSPPDEPDRGDEEGPRHEVNLEEFLMAQTPITQAQWKEVAQWPQLEG